jgi:uncharacterized protein (DUF2147 family)
MPRALWRDLLSLVLAAALTVAAGAAHAAELTGTWLTEGGKSRVKIEACGDKFCGTVIWLKEPDDDATGRPKLDARNENRALRNRPIMGLAILGGFAKTGETRWGDGTIYNPEDGDTYKCTLTLEDDNTLRVRGYVGIPLFGKTQIWHRVTE